MSEKERPSGIPRAALHSPTALQLLRARRRAKPNTPTRPVPSNTREAGSGVAVTVVESSKACS